MAEFDAELYLRLTGERALLDPGSDDGRAVIISGPPARGS